MIWLSCRKIGPSTKRKRRSCAAPIKHRKFEAETFTERSEEMELAGRVALITGGAGGIGGAVVRSLAKAGISGVAINYRKSTKEAADLAAEIERGDRKSTRLNSSHTVISYAV